MSSLFDEPVSSQPPNSTVTTTPPTSTTAPTLQADQTKDETKTNVLSADTQNQAAAVSEKTEEGKDDDDSNKFDDRDAV